MEEIAIEPQRGLNFKQVWTALKKSSADFDRCMQETDKEIKALSKNIGGLNKSPGKLIEQMFSAQLWEKFDALGYEFTQGGNRKFRENKRIIAEAPDGFTARLW